MPCSGVPISFQPAARRDSSSGRLGVLRGVFGGGTRAKAVRAAAAGGSGARSGRRGSSGRGDAEVVVMSPEDQAHWKEVLDVLLDK